MSEATEISAEVKTEAKRQFDLLKRSVVEIIPEEDLLKKLEFSIANRRPLKVKLGADPSRPDLHIGHTVPLGLLRTFQNLGHQVMFLIGDFTALIGDPTGKNETRPTLSPEEVKLNSKTYSDQIFKILNPQKTQIVFNSHWTNPLNIKDVIGLCSQITVARMLERDDFSKRYKEGQSISLHEFLYPLIQANDSVALKADVEIGGTDQKFNLLLGRDLQRNADQSPQVVITMPLLEGTDGVQKMSKSLGNAISITEEPKDIFGKIMSLSDEMMMKYYKLLTLEDLDSIKAMHPKEAKMRLGFLLVERFYDKEQAGTTQQNFVDQFSKKQIPDDIPFIALEKNQIALTKLLAENGLCSSLSEARRLIVQGAVKINDEKVVDTKHIITDLDEAVIKAGKRKFLKVKFNIKRS